MAIPIQIRGGTTAEWAAANPVIAERMLCAEKVSDGSWKFKIGDGVKTWSELPYFTQGAKGDAGPANTLTLGTVTTGAAGSSASATITGTSPNQTLNLTIPRGDQGIQGVQGPTGPANSLSIGTVTTGAAGSSAEATITGTAPSQTLNLTIPQGIQGIQGPKGDTGAGVPNGGTTGQHLVKSSGADQATAWATPALSDNSDVAISSPADKQVLQYEASTSKWKNKAATGGVSTTEPASPIAGDGWFYAEDGSLFVRYNDGSSSQWVQANPPISAQVEQRYYSPNYVINGAFDIWQRGTSFTNVVDFSADRWKSIANPQQSVSRTVVSGGGVVPETITYQADITGTTVGTSGYSYFNQSVEDVRTLAGQTVTLSFYAKGSTAGTIGATLIQDFGTGGSSAVFASGSNFNITTSWQRFSMTVALASVAGKTIGTNNLLGIRIVRGLGSSYTASSFGIPALVDYTGTLSITGVQLEQGSTATAFRRNGDNLQEELAACQRYYYRAVAESTYGYFGSGIAVASTSGVLLIPLPASMRTAPSSLEWTGSGANYNLLAGGSVTSMALSTDGGSSRLGVVSVTGTSLANPFVLRANNSTTAYIGFSAEL